jgi:hypothetical protein
VPVLVYHHEKDECDSTRPQEATLIVKNLESAPERKLVLASGGANPSGDPCGAFHWHGFVGMERQAVDKIAAFIRVPANWTTRQAYVHRRRREFVEAAWAWLA